jgi:hypothetical protein
MRLSLKWLVNEDLLANYAAVFVLLLTAATILELTFEENMVGSCLPIRVLGLLECGWWMEEGELWFEGM